MNLYVYLQGGLGNQMFQYAAGVSALKEYPQFTDLRLDTSFYNAQERKVIVNGLTGRGYDLDLFNITYNNLEETPEGETMLQGWFQNIQEFANVENLIRDEFKFKVDFCDATKQVEKEISESEHPVAIHVRRGDYINNPTANAHHGVLDKSYYDHAIGLIDKTYSNPHYFIFSEDIDWCKENINGKGELTIVGSECNDVKDSGHLYLMSKCESHILANSSFSWWGAFLGESKTAIGPKKWLADGSGSGIMLENWIKI